MTGRVEGKVAFITGAARGQGRSHAVRLAEEGADIIALDLCGAVPTVEYEASTPDDLAETVELVEKQGRRIVAVQGDVRDSASLDEAVQRGVSELGRLDIVLANAGILSMGQAHEQSDEQWNTMIDVNLSGVWRTAKAAIPTLVEQGTGGSIVITSSYAGIKGNQGVVSYCAAKFGVVGIAKSLAHELAPHQIRVNTVHPTNVRTPMLDNALTRRAFRPDLENPTYEDTVDAYVDTPFPIPTAGVTRPDPIWRTPGPAGGWIIARTDPSAPGITHFVAIGLGCGACVVHWRNLSTGAVGDALAYVHPTSPAVTGSGVLVATVSVAGASTLTILPGAGAWTVP